MTFIYFANCHCKFLALWLLILIPFCGIAQEKSQKKSDEKYFRVKVKVGDTIRFANDSIFTYHKDTLILIKRSKYYLHIFSPKKKSTTAFYDTLKSKFGRHKFTEYLIDALLVHNEAPQQPITNNAYVKSEEHFRDYEGLIIKDIFIKKVPILSGSVLDTTYNNSTPATAFANRIHSNTKDHIIRNNLIFDVGDKIATFTLADNERLIRSLGFIEDAKIIVKKIPKTNFAQVTVVIKDVWSIGASMDISGSTEYEIEVYDRNFLGLGNEISNTLLVNTEKNPVLGYDGKYKINNIKGSFINGLIQYKDAHQDEIYRASAERVFLTPQTKFAGGLSLEKKSKLVNILPFSDEKKLVRNTFYTQDFWVGRSINLARNGNRKNVIFSAGILNIRHTNRPFIAADSNFSYHDQRVYLGKIAYSKRKYFKGNFIIRFGVTEDIPEGQLLSLTMGKEYTNFKTRFYQSIDYFRSHIINGNAYLISGASLAWYRRLGRTEDGILRLTFHFFSKLKKIADRYHTRYIARLTYTNGFDRVDDQQLRLTNLEGIRGFDEKKTIGNRRLSLQLEGDLITHWNVIGFRIFPYLFTDVGLINYQQPKLLHSKNIYAGCGVGFRVRNESLVFSTFGIRFVYYPKVHLSNTIGFDFFTNDPSVLRDFNNGKPVVSRFE